MEFRDNNLLLDYQWHHHNTTLSLDKTNVYVYHKEVVNTHLITIKLLLDNKQNK